MNCVKIRTKLTFFFPPKISANKSLARFQNAAFMRLRFDKCPPRRRFEVNA
jgi:hypothetical protein